MLSLLCLTALMTRAPSELFSYLSKPDPSFAFSVKRPAEGRVEIQMTSQTWHGIPWKHTILLQQPSHPKFRGTGILYITGDGPKPGDLLALGLVAEATGMPTAMLFDIPNQPIWDMKEDDLIAHTFEKYLATGDPSWPLLFPMTKAAIRSMDAVEKATAGGPNPIHKFIVTGASKRGWTTWLVGAVGDKRVRGIAPMVFDNLNVAAQMPHQIASWGKYSAQIEDYTKRGLQAQLGTPRGSHLAQMIDPYAYRSRIHVQTLIVNGGNDPYWTADSLSLYWPGLKQPKWLVTVPNAGHTLGDGTEAIESIGAFARALAGEFAMPRQTWQFTPDGKGDLDVSVASQGLAFQKATLWFNRSTTLDFRETAWTKEAVAGISGGSDKNSRMKFRELLPRDRNVAVFCEMRYAVDGHSFSLCTPTHVFKAAEGR